MRIAKHVFRKDQKNHRDRRAEKPENGVCVATDGYIKTLDPQLRQVANVLDGCGKVD